MQKKQGNTDDVLSRIELRDDEKAKRYLQLQNRYLAFKEQSSSRTRPGEINSAVPELPSTVLSTVQVQVYQGHPTTVFGEISVRSPLEWLKFSGAQEQLKISKMFRGDCSLGSEFRDLCGLFT